MADCNEVNATASATTSDGTRNSGVVAGSVRMLLRAEGLAIAALTLLLYARTGASWWIFAALWLVPDVSMLGYLGGACRGARVYNAAHTYFLPGVLAFLALMLRADVLLPYAIIWANHIAIDRLLGYGLKYSNGFGFTHLGRTGRQPAASVTTQ